MFGTRVREGGVIDLFIVVESAFIAAAQVFIMAGSVLSWLGGKLLPWIRSGHCLAEKSLMYNLKKLSSVESAASV